jgi:hypothetical protein
MYTTVREALDFYMAFVGEEGDALARKTALGALNLAVQDINLQQQWKDQQSPAPLTLTLTVGRSRYSLPAHLARITGVVRNLTRPGRAIVPLDATSAAELYPQASTADALWG